MCSYFSFCGEFFMSYGYSIPVGSFKGPLCFWLGSRLRSGGSKSRVGINEKARGLLFNRLLPVVPFSYPLKASGNRRFSDIFRRYKKESWGSNGLRKVLAKLSSCQMPSIRLYGLY